MLSEPIKGLYSISFIARASLQGLCCKGFVARALLQGLCCKGFTKKTLSNSLIASCAPKVRTEARDQVLLNPFYPVTPIQIPATETSDFLNSKHVAFRQNHVVILPANFQLLQQNRRL